MKCFKHSIRSTTAYVLILWCLHSFVLRISATETIEDLLKLKYPSNRIYPHRTKEEAAVLEWGHSAIITALDASVAHFGPQTSQAALLEVEAKPVLAVPINGVKATSRKSSIDNESAEEVDGESKLSVLENADEVHGNLVVMTNRNNNQMTGVEMALMAQNSGAAALLLVNVNEDHPEEIYRLPAEPGHEHVQIPVVMISLNSANALTTATVTPETKKKDIVNNGMPERVRLYAGGDRPFFEDVESQEPTVYLIHNLLTEAECQALIHKAEPRVAPIPSRVNDALQLTFDGWKRHNVQRVMLWQGLLQGPASKQVEERIEQVTGFPADHFSDFIVDKYDPNSYWLSHYDTMGDGTVPLATITIFLNDIAASPDDSTNDAGGQVVFPSTRSHPIQIRPTQGLAVVHHNTDEHHDFDINAVHAQLPPNHDTLYVATKYIFPIPVSKARRIAVPLFAWPLGGKLPQVVIQLHDELVRRFGYEQGGKYFDKACIFVPALLVFGILQYVIEYVTNQMKQQSSSGDKKKSKSTTKTSTTTTAETSTSSSSSTKKPRSKTDKKNN